VTWRRVAERLKLRPSQLPEQREDRHASWLELFFDFMFVLALASVQALLNPPNRVGEVAITLLLYAVVWWAWTGQAFYDTRFDPDDVSHRLSVLIAMAGAGAMSLGAKDAPDTALLPIGYLIVRATLLVLYLRVRNTSLAARRVTSLYLIGFGVGWLLWLGSLAAPLQARPPIWIAALVIELLTPWVGRSRLAQFPVHPSHLPERIGQFTIILLGVTLTGLLNAVPSRPTAEVLGFAAVAFVVPASVWWVYTTFVSTGLALRRLTAGIGYSYVHGVLGAALLLLGWTLGQVVRQVAEGPPELPPVRRLLLASSIGTWMACGLALQRLSLGRLLPQRVGIALLGICPVALIAAVVRNPETTLVLVAAVVVTYAITLNRQLGRVSREQSGA
jgi:low temperature requirement protein LtrA